MSEIGLSCPHCSQDVSIDTAYAGQAVGCPHCGGEFTVPDAPVEPAAPAAPALAPAPAPALAPAPKLVTPPPGGGMQPPPQQPVPQQPAPAMQQPAQAPAPGYAQPPGYAPPAPGQAPGMAPAPGMPGQQHTYIPPGARVHLGGVFGNPLEAQPGYIQSNGESTAMKTGFTLSGIWLVLVWLISWRTNSGFTGSLGSLGSGPSGRGFGREPKIEFTDHLQWILEATVLLALIVVILFALKAMNGKAAGFGSIIFTSSIVVLPTLVLGVFTLLVSFIEIKTMDGAKTIGHISIILTVFTLSAVLLLLKASLVSVLGYAQKAAFWLVPAVLLAIGYLANWAGNLIGEIGK